MAAKRVAECDRQRGLKNRGKGDSGAKYFAQKVAEPGKQGEKSHKA